MSQSIAFRGDPGLQVAAGPPFSTDNNSSTVVLDSSKNCKAMLYSNNGRLLAWSNGSCVQVAKLSDDGQKFCVVEKTKIDGQRAQFFAWSPNDSFLATWQVFAVKGDDPDHNRTPEPNLKIWKVDFPDSWMAYGQVQRKSDGWQPSWSNDETLCAMRSANNEVAFYKPANNGSSLDPAERRLSLPKMESFSLSPKGSHIVAFLPGKKGAPGFVKMFAYPNLHPEKDVVAVKSFMLADRMDARWSHDSKAVLLLMQSEVDKSGASYYGKTQLTYMDTTGESSLVDLPKAGPIYHVAWCPTSANGSGSKSVFAVVYGFMPAKATLFNRKCEKVFDFGTGPRNLALFNAQGSLLMTGGFGNLRGNIEMWDMTRDNKPRVAAFEAPDSTDVRWSPDGQHILTTTCAPRLRMSNGYKVWHYSSTLLHETTFREATNTTPVEELWEATWRPRPSLKDITFSIRSSPIGGGLQPKQPQASKQVYVPPAARGKVPSVAKQRKDDEPPQSSKSSSTDDNLSKSAAKNKKRREAAKKKKCDDLDAAKESNAINDKSSVVNATTVGTGDPDKDKKIRKLTEKLTQIAKLKQQVNDGKQLEVNQLDKIKKEADLLAEIEKLKLS